MKTFLGSTLRILAFFWFASSVFALVSGASGRYSSDSMASRGLVGACLSVAVFWLGTWLKKQPPAVPISKRARQAKSAWWSVDFGTRLVAFLGVLWIVGAFFAQDSFYRDWGVILVPPFIVASVYLAFLKLVIGTPSVSTAALPARPPEARPIVSPVEALPPDPIADMNSKKREQAMNELIRRMRDS